MNITRVNAVGVMESLGFLTAPTWAREKMEQKINLCSLKSNPLSDVIDVELRKQYQAIVDAVAKKEKIVVTYDGDPAPTAAAPAPKATKLAKAAGAEAPAPKATAVKTAEAPVAKPAAPSKVVPATKAKVIKAEKPAKPAKAVVAKKPLPEKDAFGNRKDSQAAKINALLKLRPKSEDDLIKESGLPVVRVRDHLSLLLQAGKVVKSVVRTWALPPAKE